MLRKRTSRSTISAVSVAAVGLIGGCFPLLTGCGSPPGGEPSAGAPYVAQVSGPTMGTTYRAAFVAEADDASNQIVYDAITERLALVNRQMSTYDPESELSEFNRSRAADWFSVSGSTSRVVEYCLRLADESGGAFDPTVGPLVNLWGFGPDGAAIDPPADAEVAAALEKVGHAKIEARLDPPGLRKADAVVSLDLSAAAKGHGVDAIAELLEQRGFVSYLVEIGGEIRTRGDKPDGSPWRIGVEAPDAGGRRVQRVIEPGDAAVATSGDYRNFFEHEGRSLLAHDRPGDRPAGDARPGDRVGRGRHLHGGGRLSDRVVGHGARERVRLGIGAWRRRAVRLPRKRRHPDRADDPRLG